ncbi:GvpL/GvpF family gas vesicle protein [Streptomyces sp. NBC_01497]|uniref:GvpL/GvpF family gas vesicle protein n=1 Tax=Streptomyces sp. NBC_01497 TaxID=2903885 RepID=UPI002E30CFBA|nr:GvpL/GvpF family gas vesicle protein [Streptomyces sp. NBC_01497]
MTTHGLYVYAIVPAGQRVPPGLRGVGTPPTALRVLSQGRISAVVSEAPPKLRPRRRDLLAHQEVLRRLIEGGPVLPTQFGMVALDEASLSEQLANAEAQHVPALERVAGRVEMNVKALPASDALAHLVREDSGIRRLREEARRRPGYEANVKLGEALVSALSGRAAVAGRQAVVLLTPLSHAVAAGPEVSGCVLNMSFLVDEADGERFEKAAARFAALHRDRVELRVSGPLPCYSFVEPAASLAGAGA